ncbi:hypothetical protein DPMN_028575 [Dreissena polymorpha]|uniref:Uncharacterized protein n=1 Tax=Dreissena polymorpha TaxID=45954 RepID=A0A9D4LUZ1_DREPO|nr:hypothetical protein DPMN_028575 [Dreissena polymorpha]
MFCAIEYNVPYNAHPTLSSVLLRLKPTPYYLQASERLEKSESSALRLEHHHVNRMTTGRHSDGYRRGIDPVPQECRKVLINRALSGRQSCGQRPCSLRAKGVHRKRAASRNRLNIWKNHSDVKDDETIPLRAKRDPFA